MDIVRIKLLVIKKDIKWHQNLIVNLIIGIK